MFTRLYLQHALPKGVQRFRYGGIWASCSRAKLHAAQALLNIVKTVDAVKGYIEKEFIPEVRRFFECPNCHCLSSHWFFYNTSWMSMITCQNVNPIISNLISGMRGCLTPLRPILSCFSLCGTVFVPFNPVSYPDYSSVSIGLLGSKTFCSPFPRLC